MFLDYFSLAILLVGVTVVIYTALYIHDIPHQIAKKRGHPQTEAIHVACWLSLFTLHALWPIVFIWAVSNREQLPGTDGGSAQLQQNINELQEKIEKLERRLSTEGVQS